MANIPTVDAYLERIGLEGAPAIDLDGLAVLQASHLSAVPFENLDVHAGTGVRTDTGWSLPKIVERDRGGWCFENNGSFGWLLRELGFDVTYTGAYVLLEPPDYEHMSHLCLIVQLDQPYLVDVGFGDSFIGPLPIDGRHVDDGNAIHAVVFDDPWFTLVEVNADVIDISPNQRPLYRFERIARSLPDFDIESDRLQTHSHFTEKPFATRLIDGGPDRVTLLSDRLKFRRNGEWTEQPVDPSDWEAVYQEWFFGR
jgi:N-hydroxyarylamine O-acetyltransferase